MDMHAGRLRWHITVHLAVRGYERSLRAESSNLLDMTKFTSKPGDSLLDATAVIKYRPFRRFNKITR